MQDEKGFTNNAARSDSRIKAFELPIEYYISLINPLVRTQCENLYKDKRELFDKMKGSKRNHQPWAGGYADHIKEVMALGLVLFADLYAIRPLNFLLEDVILVLFIHDLEKLYPDQVDTYQQNTGCDVKTAKKVVREGLFHQFGLSEYIERNHAVRVALDTVEGEGDKYSRNIRVMNELGALCHCADTLSARLWYDFPKLSPPSSPPPTTDPAAPKMGTAMKPNGDPTVVVYDGSRPG